MRSWPFRSLRGYLNPFPSVPALSGREQKMRNPLPFGFFIGLSWPSSSLGSSGREQKWRNPLPFGFSIGLSGCPLRFGKPTTAINFFGRFASNAVVALPKSPRLSQPIPQRARPVRKGAENAESAPFRIFHRPFMAFQLTRVVRKGAEMAESAPFRIWHRPSRTF